MSDSDSGAGGSGDSADTGDLPACAPPGVSGSPVSEMQMPSSMAATLCIAWEQCCAEHPPSQSCRHGMNMEFERLREQAAERGLVYDGACVGQQQALVEALGCSIDPDPALVGPGWCAIYVGDRGLGTPCESLDPTASDCAQGLACWDGVCADPCGTAPSDRRTPYGYGCPSGLRMLGSGKCVAPADVGEMCNGGCVEGAYCHVTHLGPGCHEKCEETVCAPLVGLGGKCDVDDACAPGLCVDRACAAGPGEGDPCLDGRCAGGFGCDGGTCVPEPALCAMRLD